MLKYRAPQLFRAGFIGVALIVLVIAVGLQPVQLVNWATKVRYQAVFTEAGGLEVGNDVKVSGVKVGDISEVALRGGKVVVTFTVDGKVQFGNETTAHIRTGSLLGRRMLTLESAGSRTMAPLTTIPVSRTSSPYSLSDAIGDLTTDVAGINTASLNQSLDTLSATIDHIAPQLGPTFDGLTQLSRSLNSRDESLRDLVKHAADVTGVLSERSQKVNSLILNANALLDVLAQRRHVIVDLLVSISAVSHQLSGLVADNENQLKPTLEKLNSVTAMLEKNRDTISKVLPGVYKYEITQAETIATGHYATAYVANLAVLTLQPFLDYAFGFRRGNATGQAPDRTAPRAEFPWPHRQIPVPPR
ncbi:MCE family protein [Mycobacterium terramassiliense]|uniref:ABC-type transporter Mla maintaining outer membrane lipid asymmetry, periplasmic component MlaD n=1 Tax=Mycobacterium terramassiliense TaxID=1841859 RepID=A0A2U3NGC9_9MYCO|nr:MCE family protein [Mycobacterium terramassiliense]SPM30601.1 ABC-type transporter Mla maintaining outer membrane lipid asymmetry, periplasmic component MlaD [Mycobacterium terramassiliense]